MNKGMTNGAMQRGVAKLTRRALLLAAPVLAGITGGLGSAVADVLVDGDRVPFRRHGIPDEFVPVGPPAALYAHYRLDAPGIAAVAREFAGERKRLS